jgi:hypothetical protein
VGCDDLISPDRERRVAGDSLLDRARGNLGGGKGAGEQLLGRCQNGAEGRAGGGEACGRQPRVEAGALPVEPGIEHRPG